MKLEQTPSQTVGPFFHAGLVRDGENRMALDGVRGTRIVITGQVIDGEGNVVPDALIELWHADGAGIYPHANDPRHADADPKFRGIGRCDTRQPGDSFFFETIKPGRVPDANGAWQAPHVCVRIFSRGLLTHLTTRLYFADEAPANERDAVFARVDAARRRTLLAAPVANGAGLSRYRWNIILQGPGETVFFEP